MVQIKFSLALILTAATAFVTVVALPVPTGPTAVASSGPHTRPNLKIIIPSTSQSSSSGSHSFSSSPDHPASSSPGSHNVSPGPSPGFHTYASDSSASSSPESHHASVHGAGVQPLNVVKKNAWKPLKIVKKNPQT